MEGINESGMDIEVSFETIAKSNLLSKLLPIAHDVKFNCFDSDSMCQCTISFVSDNCNVQLTGTQQENSFLAEQAAIECALNLLRKIAELDELKSNPKGSNDENEENPKTVLQTMKNDDNWPYFPFEYETNKVNDGFISTVELVHRITPKSGSDRVKLAGTVCRSKKQSLESVARIIIGHVQEYYKSNENSPAPSSVEASVPNAKEILNKRFGAMIKYETLPTIGGYFVSKSLLKGEFFEGIPCRNKKLAELSVAEKMVQHFAGIPDTQLLEEGEVPEENMTQEINPKSDLNIRMQYRFPNHPPKYTTVPTAGGFVCTVSYGDGIVMNESITGDVCKNKKMAENSAAAAALLHLRSKRQRITLRSDTVHATPAPVLACPSMFEQHTTQPPLIPFKELVCTDPSDVVASNAMEISTNLYDSSCKVPMD